MSSDSSEYELGESVVTQEGRLGEKTITYSIKTNLFNLLFGMDGYIEEVSARTGTDPVEKIVSRGTKRYQYMLCSDGSYRYYSDEQFKDPMVGFTSKSEDSCIKSGQGTKIRLADDTSGGLRQGPSSQIDAREANLPTDPSCRKTDIVKYKTITRSDDYLAPGVRQVAVYGRDGYTFTCPILGHSEIVHPTDEIVDVGTGKNAERNTEAGRLAEQQRRRNEINARQDRISNCISSVKSQIRTGGSAFDQAIAQCYKIP